MLPKEQLSRINQLSKKAKTSGLSIEEQNEQQKLRRAYLEAFRGSMKKTLQGVTIIDPNGDDVTPEKLKREKKNNLH